MSEVDLNETACENCGATYWSVHGGKVVNCDQCPGHDDIARRNQESADSCEVSAGGKDGK